MTQGESLQDRIARLRELDGKRREPPCGIKAGLYAELYRRSNGEYPATDSFRNEAPEMMAVITELEARLGVAKEALRFYASHSTYADTRVCHDVECCGNGPLIDDDWGDVAIAAHPACDLSKPFKKEGR